MQPSKTVWRMAAGSSRSASLATSGMNSEFVAQRLEHESSVMGIHPHVGFQQNRMLQVNSATNVQ